MVNHLLAGMILQVNTSNLHESSKDATIEIGENVYAKLNCENLLVDYHAYICFLFAFMNGKAKDPTKVMASKSWFAMPWFFCFKTEGGGRRQQRGDLFRWSSFWSTDSASLFLKAPSGNLTMKL